MSVTRLHRQAGVGQADEAPPAPRRAAASAGTAWGQVATTPGAGPGRPLDRDTRTEFEPRFGVDLADVRVHADAQADASARNVNALAFTLGRDITFRRGQYAPSTPVGKRLLAHELAHVVQQRRGGPAASDAALEHEAWRASETATTAGQADVRHAAVTGRLHASTLSAALTAAWTARHDKGEIFDLLRRAAPAPGDMDSWTVLGTIFAAGTDDAWLAGQIMLWGAEPLWPPWLVSERVRRASAGHWAPEAGNIGAALPDPGAAAGTAAPTVQAFFFPGRSDRRALVISGVHGSEPEGVAAVQQLRALLAARSATGPARPPFFTTIVVPIVIPRTATSGSRTVPGVPGIGIAGRPTTHDADPNRNFPLPGEGLATAQARGAASAAAPELQIFDPTAPGGTRAPHDTAGPGHQVSSIRMIPETRILLGLIERFQPERIASVHAHSLKRTVGDAPGIFVDPRGIDPRTGAVIDAAQASEDDRLATAMVREGRSRLASAPLPTRRGRRAPFDPFTGNAAAGSPASTVHYASTVHAEGNSLGGWAPVPVAGAGARAGITTVTVEVPAYGAGAAAALARVEALDAELLADVFLEDPALVTPASGPTVP